MEWKRALRVIGVGDGGLLSAGLSGGGATAWHLRQMGVPRVCLCGRWSSGKTLEREALYHRLFVEALTDWRVVARLDQLARTTFSRHAGWIG